MAQLQQPPQRGGDALLSFKVGQPLSWQLVPQERLQPVLGDGLQPRSHVSEPNAASASAAMRTSSARSRPSAATVISDPWCIRTVSGTSRSIHKRGIPGDVHEAGYRWHTR